MAFLSRCFPVILSSTFFPEAALNLPCNFLWSWELHLADCTEKSLEVPNINIGIYIEVIK